MAKPTVIFIGGEKGGVGKTTLARLLLDYMQVRGLRRPRVFDCEHPEGTLRRFAPDAQVIDIERIEDQMRLFDGMTAETPTLVDIRAGIMSRVVRTLDELQLLQDVRRGEMALLMFHVIGPTPESLREIAALADGLGVGAKYFLVKNHINRSGFFDWATSGPEAQILATAQRVTIGVPHLAPRAAEEVQHLSASFVAYARDPARSRTLRGIIDTWLDAAFADLDRLNVAEAIAGTKPEPARVVPIAEAKAG